MLDLGSGFGHLLQSLTFAVPSGQQMWASYVLSVVRAGYPFRLQPWDKPLASSMQDASLATYLVCPGPNPQFFTVAGARSGRPQHSSALGLPWTSCRLRGLTQLLAWHLCAECSLCQGYHFPVPNTPRRHVAGCSQLCVSCTRGPELSHHPPCFLSSSLPGRVPVSQLGSDLALAVAAC